MTLHFKTQPYEHQRAIVEQTIDRKAFGLFCEQGTGKTKMVLDTFGNLPEELQGLLILAPNGVHANWVLNEIPKHADFVRLLTLIWNGGGTKKWAQNFERTLECVQSGGYWAILAMNIEAIRTKRGFDHARRFLEAGPCMMVIDESTVIKNPKAIQTKQALKLAPLAKYRRVLTGTPVEQGPLDLYAQIQFLSPEIWPHGSWTAFKHDFAIEQLCSSGTHKYTKIVGYRNIDKLQSLIKDHTIQIKKKDCLDLPDKIYESFPVTLTKEQQDHYNSLKSMALTMLSDGKMLTATNSLTILLRLQQIVCGHLATDDGTLTELPTNRIAALEQIIEGTDSKIIIWAHFKADIRRICKILEEKYGLWSTVNYFGETSSDMRSEAIHRFQEDCTCRFFVANEAASRGLTLTASDTVVYFSNNTKLGYRLQSEDRNHRIGQKNNVVYHDLVAYGTVDEKVFAAIQAKKDLAAEVMSGVVSLKDLL